MSFSYDRSMWSSCRRLVCSTPVRLQVMVTKKLLQYDYNLITCRWSDVSFSYRTYNDTICHKRCLQHHACTQLPGLQDIDDGCAVYRLYAYHGVVFSYSSAAVGRTLLQYYALKGSNWQVLSTCHCCCLVDRPLEH